MKNSFIAREKPDLEFVWSWFEFQAIILSEARTHILSPTRGVVAGRGYEVQFTGQANQEIDRFFATQREQLNLLTMFELLATVEALLRLDFDHRVRNKLKDGISRRFRQIAARDWNARLDEDILQAWKDEHSVKVADFRAALKLRHWLAHGRHWHPKLGQGYQPADVYAGSSDLLRSLNALGLALPLR